MGVKNIVGTLLVNGGEVVTKSTSIIAIFNISSDNTTIELYNLASDVDHYIDWGDGTIDRGFTHTYKTIGEYICKILNATRISNRAFMECNSLTSIVIGNGIASIGSNAFRLCTRLTSVVIGDSVTEIGSWAFYGCNDLTSVVIGDSVTAIGPYAFEMCDGLTSITIPDSVTEIGSYAFCNSDGLTSVIFKNAIPITYKTDLPWFNGCTSLTHIYVPYGCKQAYIDKWTVDGAPQDILDKIVESDREAMMSDLNELVSSGLSNIEDGIGNGSLQQVQNQEANVTEGYFNFTDKNPNATYLDPTLTGEIQYGATGDFASALGGKSSAQGKRSHAEGTTTIAKGDYSHTEGNATVTLGANSHAEGAITTAFGGTSHAEGRRTLAHGEASHAEGVETEAHGAASHAEGELTKTRGYSSHAEGGFTETGKENDENLNGLYAHAEGAHTKAYGQISHAEGVNTEATGYASHVGGMNTIADQSAQTVIGKFNDPNAVRAYSDPRGGSLFQIGIGSSDTDRKNAINILGDGDIVLYFNGEYYSLNKIIATLGGFKYDTKAQD